MKPRLNNLDETLNDFSTKLLHLLGSSVKQLYEAEDILNFSHKWMFNRNVENLHFHPIFSVF